MTEERTPAQSGPEKTPEQRIQGILAAEDLGDNQEPVEDVADDAEVDETEADELEASDEDTEEPESDESDEPEEDEQEPDETPVYRVRVDGEEIEVTLDELQKGYSRQADYTRKAQALAEQRRAVEQEIAQARAEREYYQQTLQQLQQQVMTQQEREPDWDQEYDKDPIRAARLEREWRVRKEQQARVMQEQQRVALQQQQEQAMQMQRLVAEQRQRLPELIPEWQDEQVAAQEREGIRKLLAETGFTDAEIAQIYDARAVALARDAMRYRQQQQKRQELRPAPKKGPKPAAPRAAATPVETQQKSLRAQRQRLAQTGRIEDAAAMIANFI